MKKNAYNKVKTYDRAVVDDDFEFLAKEVIAKSDEKNVSITKDPKKLKQLMKTDLREDIPPQIYALISSVVDLVKTVEDQTGDKNESKQSVKNKEK